MDRLVTGSLAMQISRAIGQGTRTIHALKGGFVGNACPHSIFITPEGNTGLACLGSLPYLKSIQAPGAPFPSDGANCFLLILLHACSASLCHVARRARRN